MKDEILSALKKNASQREIRWSGKAIRVGDGVVVAGTVPGIKFGETVRFPGGEAGLVMSISEKETGIVVMGPAGEIKEGEKIEFTGKVLQVTAAKSLLGRVTDALMRPIDSKRESREEKDSEKMQVERVAAGVIDRQDVRTPLITGTVAVDALVPIGRGQRELIIGDRSVGKTTLAVDAIINQARINKQLGKGEKRVISIYVAIGQKQSKVAEVVGKLQEENAMAETIVVTASASDPASMQFIAPFAATAVAEYFMNRGEDVLIIYDDLSKHAWAYRELSLLLKKPSGREAYPGDIFYLHSRLLERAARMKDSLGGGSITALPIIETQAGDISAYIPTNVISITDGQIFLDTDLFYAGVRPAVSVGASVSRVGGDAQIKAMKQVAGKLKLDLAQYRELASFAQFGSDLDSETKKKLAHGKVMTEALKQERNLPQGWVEQVAALWLSGSGHLEGLEVAGTREYIKNFLQILANHKKKPIGKLSEEKKLTDEILGIFEQTAKEGKWKV